VDLGTGSHDYAADMRGKSSPAKPVPRETPSRRPSLFQGLDSLLIDLQIREAMDPDMRDSLIALDNRRMGLDIQGQPQRPATDPKSEIDLVLSQEALRGPKL
jgi:hypothetical protein